jgi:hypothetical protein
VKSVGKRENVFKTTDLEVALSRGVRERGDNVPNLRIVGGRVGGVEMSEGPRSSWLPLKANGTDKRGSG